MGTEERCFLCSGIVLCPLSLLYLVLATWFLMMVISDETQSEVGLCNVFYCEAIPIGAGVLLFVGFLGWGCMIGCTSIYCCQLSSHDPHSNSGGGGCTCSDCSLLRSLGPFILCAPVYLGFFVLAASGLIWISAVGHATTLATLLSFSSLAIAPALCILAVCTSCISDCIATQRRRRREFKPTAKQVTYFRDEALTATISRGTVLHVCCTTLGGSDVLSRDFPMEAQIVELGSAIQQVLGWQDILYFGFAEQVDSSKLLKNHNQLTLKRSVSPGGWYGNASAIGRLEVV